MNNRMWNIRNPNQGFYKKVLCVCSAGLLRSPTLAWVLSNDPYNYNTRAAGVNKDYALVPLDDVLLNWADEVVFVEQDVYDLAKQLFNLEVLNTKVLNVPDIYRFRDPKLVEIIMEQYGEPK